MTSSSIGTQNCFKMGLLTYLALTALFSIATITIIGIINHQVLKNKLEEKKIECGDTSLYLKINEVQPHTVSASYYDRYGNKEDVEFESSDGVKDVYRGQIIR